MMAKESRPIRELPVGYVLRERINLKENLCLALWLNLAAFGVFVITGVGMIQILNRKNPNLFPDTGFTFTIDIGTSLFRAAIVIVVLILVLLAHEAVHGLFFWTATGTRPVFGLHLSYAYAAAPDWYIPTRTYLWIGLAPLVLLDLFLAMWMMIAPESLYLYLAAAFLLNTTGSVGDLWILFSLLKSPRPTLVNDLGHEVNLYSKALPD